MTLEVWRVETATQRLDAYDVRREVFIVGQQVPESIERDDLDEGADHVVAYVDGTAVGAGRLVVTGAVGRIGRMAVRANARRQGVGAALLAELEAIARDRGCAVVQLHAQVHAAGFYQALGYAAFGDVFVEAGIEHVSMSKSSLRP